METVTKFAKPKAKGIDTSGFKFAKPGPRVKSQPKDGRLIESPKEYRITKRKMWEQQGRRCGVLGCGEYLPTPAHGHRHHCAGRGLGGGKRDDRFTILVCIPCHKVLHS